MEPDAESCQKSMEELCKDQFDKMRDQFDKMMSQLDELKNNASAGTNVLISS